ncbi:3-hydroxybutyrate oligomer hydrolase family protein [Vibrio sp. M60_M31a]
MAGVFHWGPLVTGGISSHTVEAFTGQVSGTEYQAIVDDGSGKTNVKLVVQVPKSGFSTESPLYYCRTIIRFPWCLWGGRYGR